MCVIDANDEKLLEFDNKADCDAAVAIFNADCATCQTDCGKAGSVWTSTHEATNGKFYCSIHPDKKVGVEGVLTYAEKTAAEVDI